MNEPLMPGLNEFMLDGNPGRRVEWYEFSNSKVNVTFGSTETEVMQLRQKLEWSNGYNERLRASVEKLKAMLPPCKQCAGSGSISGGGWHQFSCSACDGLGVTQP